MDIYSIAWKNLEKKIAATRRRSIHRSDLNKWMLEALEEAVDKCEAFPTEPLAVELDARIPPEDRPHAR